jgi:endonuclease-3 related protein
VILREVLDVLTDWYGESEWWPSETRFEIAVGAILTQRVSWENVLKAVRNLKESGRMSPQGIVSCGDSELQALIRPSGFYRQKSKYLRDFSAHVMENYRGDMALMRNRSVSELRPELLSLKGIGPETADTILLYALGLPSFIVDSYSIRLLTRLRIYNGTDYPSVKAMFERVIGEDVARMALAHAAIVNHCKERCKAHDPVCFGCPLAKSCPSYSHEHDQQVAD